MNDKIKVEETRVYYYRGVKYDSWDKAEEARIAFEKSKIPDDIILLQKRAKVRIQDFEKYLIRYGGIGLLIFYEKHGNRFFHITSKEDLLKVSKKIFLERVDKNYPWYYDVDLELAKKILEMDDRELMYAFLDDHSKGEYERMYFESYETA